MAAAAATETLSPFPGSVGVNCLLGLVLVLMYFNGLRIAMHSKAAADVARGLGFLFVCIPVRLAMAVFLPYYPPELLFIIGVMFLWQHLSGGRDRGFFGGKVWWRCLRPIHGALFVLAGALACSRQTPEAQAVLVLDVAIAAAARLAA